MKCDKCDQEKNNFTMNNPSFIEQLGNVCGDCYPVPEKTYNIPLLQNTLNKTKSNSMKSNLFDVNQGQESPTGSLRYNKGKAGVHQIPPEVLLDIAKVLDYGATKYSEFNWAKGNKLSVPYSCAMRHLLAFWGGEDIDKESGEPHLAHVMTNIMMMMYYKKNFSQFDDRFFKKGE